MRDDDGAWHGKPIRLRREPAAGPSPGSPLVAAPLPVIAALIVTAKPVYPGDACFYGAPADAVRWTDDYLGLMVPLAAFGLAAAASVVASFRLDNWRPLALALFGWAALTVIWQPASHPIMYPYGLVGLFGIFFTPPLLVVVAAFAKQSGWMRAIAWFEALYLLPVLLGLAKILAQPPCIPKCPSQKFAGIWRRRYRA